MEKSRVIPLTDPRVSKQMRAYLLKKGFRLAEYVGALTVLGEEGGEPFELGYDLFCAIARAHCQGELSEIDREED